MPDDQTPYISPKEKSLGKGINFVIMLALISAVAFGITRVVPTWIDAVNLIGSLTASLTSTLITGAILAAVVILLYQVFSPHGKINGLVRQKYSSLIHGMATRLLNDDPISPLKDAEEEARQKLAIYDKAWADYDGQVEVLRQRQQSFAGQASDAETEGRAAQRIGNQQAFSRAAYRAQSAKQTADQLLANINSMETYRKLLARLRDLANDLIYKLGIDIENTQARWEAAKSMDRMTRMARGIINPSDKAALTSEARQIVQQQYGAALGRLRNLDELARPLLDAKDLSSAVADQALLDKIQREDLAAAIPVQARVLQPIAIEQSDFGNLIK